MHKMFLSHPYHVYKFSLSKFNSAIAIVRWVYSSFFWHFSNNYFLHHYLHRQSICSWFLSTLLGWQTTKERHMWTCPFHPPIQLYFIIRNTERSADFGISRIKIWNYNRSLSVCIFIVAIQFHMQSFLHIFWFILLLTSEMIHFAVCQARKSYMLVCCHYNAWWLYRRGGVRGVVLFKQWLTELPVSLSKCGTGRD